jgi:hypothetical protein
MPDFLKMPHMPMIYNTPLITANPELDPNKTTSSTFTPTIPPSHKYLLNAGIPATRLDIRRIDCNENNRDCKEAVKEKTRIRQASSASAGKKHNPVASVRNMC